MENSPSLRREMLGFSPPGSLTFPAPRVFRKNEPNTDITGKRVQKEIDTPARAC